MFPFNRISYFKKLLASYLIIVFVPMVLISSVYYHYYSVQIQDGVEAKAQTSLVNYSGLVSTVAAEVDRLSLQFSFIKELSLVLSDPHFNIYNYSVLQTNIQTSIFSNPLVYSVYLYTKVNNKVLTTREGIFSLDEFYDRSIVEDAVKNENTVQWHEVRTLRGPIDSPGVDVITVIRRVPSAQRDSQGILVFNIRKDLFFSNVSSAKSDGRTLTYVVDSSRHILYPDDSKINAEFKKFVQSDQFRATGLWTRGEKDKLPYYIATLQSPQFGWSYVNLIPDGDYLALLRDKMTSIVAVIMIVTLVFASLSYVLTVVMYVPFKQILAALTTRLKMESSSGPKNEFDLVTHAIDHILTENEQIKSTVLQNQPIIKARWIHDLFHQSLSTDQTANIEKLRELGIDFSYPYVIELIVYIDARSLPGSDLQKTKLFLFSLIENSFSDPYRIAGTILDGQTFGFILNTEQPVMNEELRQSLSKTAFDIIHLVQNELRVNLQFLFGNVHASLRELNETMRLDTRQLRYKAFINQVDVVFSSDFQQKDLSGYPAQYVNLLLVCIRSGDRIKVREIVGRFFETYVYPMKYAHEKLLEILVRILSVVVHELQQNDDDISGISTVNVLQIHQVQNKQELEAFVQRYIEKIMDGLNHSEEGPQNLHITRAIEYIKTKYRHNISISDIADHLQISSSYLSRIFKLELGKSPLEYLTEYRIERGKEYLSDQRLSLQDISERIGYSDSHSFIRFFKRSTGTTPGEYRSRLLK